MFKKEAAYKPSATIRGSERKTLAADVQSHFPSVFIDKTPEEIKETIDSIVPTSGIESVTFTSTKGQRGTLYSHSAEPIFVKVEGKLIPSLQTVWRHPTLVTTVLTGAQVLANLARGSDLMTKGMFDYSANVKTGQVVGIRVTDRDYIVALGTAAIDFDKIDKEEGGKGIFSCLCLGDTITPEASYLAISEQLAQAALLTEKIGNITVDDDNSEPVPEEDDVVEHEVTIEQAEPPMTTPDIDNAFYQALLYGLYTVESNGDRSDVSLPISSSTLVDTYLLPYLPTRHPDLVFRKTSWKKAAKFITKQKFLKSKDSKGQVTITSIDWTYPDLTNFVPYRLPRASDTTPPKAEEVKQTTESSKKCQVSVEELYKVPSEMYPLFVTKIPTDCVTSEDLRASLQEYFVHNNLVTDHPKMITVDPDLRSLLASKSSQKTLSRDVLTKDLIRACARHYRIVNPQFPATAAARKVRAGAPPTITITTESRNVKKATTKVTNLQNYFTTFQIAEIQDQLRVMCQASVSVGETKSGKPGMNMEVVVQGKKDTEVVAVLKERGIKKEWMKIEDKSGKH